MKIVFCKNGKSIRFNHAGSTMGGEMEAPLMLRLLANNNPDSTFYIIGRSDFSKLSAAEKSSLFDYDNVIDCWAEKSTDVPMHLVNWFKKRSIQLDASIMMVGQIGTVTIPGKVEQVKDRSLIASVIDMTLNYCTPINVFHNENLNIPVVEICNDPRYVLNQSRDTIYTPKVSLSQYNEEYIQRHFASYSNQDLFYTSVPQIYAEMEKVFMYQKTPLAVDPSTRTVPFAMVLNEGVGSRGTSRYNQLNEWVLKHQREVEVYGVWDEKHTSKDSRFKGVLDIKNLIKMMSTVRTSLAIPIKEGWVTSKYIELIYMGVVPFFHSTYDDQNHTKVPEFLRPKTPKELYDRVKMLENDTLYLKTITALQKLFFKPEYFDGTRLNQIVMQTINPNYVLPAKTEKTLVIDNLEDFFE